MSSTKNTARQFLISKVSISYYAVAIVFFIFGLIIKRIPLVDFNRQLDLGDLTTALIALVGLIGAWYIIPAVIEKAVQQRQSKDAIIVGDLKELCDKLQALNEMYGNLYANDRTITEKLRGQILQQVRQITNMISELASDMETEHPSLDFNQKVKNHYNEKTYKVLTEDLPINAPISKEHHLASSNSIITLTARVKKYRFSTFE